MKLNVHAGHNPDGKAACGAVGIIKESTEARKVKEELIQILKQDGHTIYDCTCDDGINQNDILKKIVDKCNSHTVDLDISIHFNSGANDSKGNGKSTGSEVFVYSESAKSKPYAEKIVTSIEKLGFKNRGVKISTALYVLRNTKNPALLVECCFVDDKDDVALYNYKTMAKAIAEGIIGKAIKEPEKEDSSDLYKVQTGAFKEKKNADSLAGKLKKDGYDTVIVKA